MSMKRFTGLCLLSSTLVLGACAGQPLPDPHGTADGLGGIGQALAGAKAVQARGLHDQALQQYRAILLVAPDALEPKLEIANIYLAQGQVKKAEDSFRVLLAEQPDHPRVRQGLGLALLQQGADLEAHAHLSAASEAPAFPDQWRSLAGLGVLADRAEDWATADRLYAVAMSLEPNAAALHNNVGVSHLLRGDGETQAVIAFTRALEIDPRFEAARNNLVIALSLRGDYQEALRNGRGAPAALNNIGYAALLRGDREVAGQYFIKAQQMRHSHYGVAADNARKLEHGF